ncbi:hypothetical protein PR048_018748 [Dryococelus australis]|uniref:Uncharacterized protein n=1 Tax=Dryococelus australis TaxID=614101 RepID=A0ABQ9HDA4_9NEOP|nr:hypothetical protein PR048_018748 [Dryococelus australis]
MIALSQATKLDQRTESKMESTINYLDHVPEVPESNREEKMIALSQATKLDQRTESKMESTINYPDLVPEVPESNIEEKMIALIAGNKTGSKNRIKDGINHDTLEECAPDVNVLHEETAERKKKANDPTYLIAEGLQSSPLSVNVVFVSSRCKDEPPHYLAGAAVVEWADYSHPTWENRVQFLAGSLLSVGFLGDLPFAPPMHSGTAQSSPRFNLIGSQDIDVRNRASSSTPTTWPDHFLHSASRNLH